MLDLLKQYASGWVAQLLIALLVLSFAVWGVSDIFSGFGQNAIARVGDTEVPVREFQRRYDNAARNFAAQTGQALTPQQLVQTGIPQQVIAQLVNEATLSDAASNLGLGISNETAGRMLTEDPGLRGPTGVYDRTTAAQFIASQGMTENEFALSRKAAYVRNQLVQALGSGITVPDAYLRAAHEYRAQQRDISYVLVAGPNSSEIPEPTETELAAYYDSTRTQWRAPEYRGLRYFLLSPAEIADPEAVSDEEAKLRYDRQVSRFTIPEFRNVEQIVFPDRAEAATAAAELQAGKSFDDLIAQRNLKPEDVNLGFVTREQIVDPAVAEAAFAMTEVGVSPVIDGRFGAVIARVTEIEPAIVTEFETAKRGLKQEIALERAADQILDLHDAIEDARAGGATVPEAAARYELEVVAVPAVDANGNDPDGNPVDVPASVVADAFQSDVGLENNPVEPDRASFAWYDVTAIRGPRELPLDEVRQRVVGEWLAAEQEKRLLADAAVVKDRLEAGETIADVAADLSLNVRTEEDITRVTQPRGELSSAVIFAAFEGPEGQVGIASGPVPNTKIVLVVDSVTTPPYFAGAPELASTEEQLTIELANDLLALFVTEVRSHTEYTLNQPVLQAVLGIGPN